MNLTNIISLVFLGVLLVAGLILGPQSCQVVEPGHRGVSVTLGNVSPKVVDEGLVAKWPFLEKVVQVNVQQTTKEDDFGTYSSDMQTVTVKFKTLYRIPEGKVVELWQQYKGDPYESLILPRIQEELKQTTALYRAEQLVKNREKIKGEVLERVRKSVGDIIDIRDVSIANFDFTDELEAAIETKTIREQEALAKQFELDKAKKDAEIAIVSAQAEAEAVRIKGNALRQNPGVVELEIVNKWDGSVPSTVVIGGGKAGANILLPLGTSSNSK